MSIILGANGICIGYANDQKDCERILHNWNYQQNLVVSQCDATNKETITADEAINIIWNGVPLSVHSQGITNFREEIQLTLIRGVTDYLGH